ncbi:MAG: mycothiol synthase [Microthrixaceae bacterium]|nr:mycothiol synthase [Microthrixaceae bacterium]
MAPDPADSAAPVLDEALDAALDAVARHGGRLESHRGAARWWITDPDSAAEDAAAHLGLRETRRLHQMRRPLPYDGDVSPAPTRPFDPERDTDHWLTVNNEAFTWHPDQGGWTRSDLDERMAEPWFDLDDFRVTVDSPLTGFCWTKLHPAGTADPSVAVGEIYVIAVSPASAGRGQGAALTVAGLDHQWRTHGTPIGMLYVESTNDRALATYRRLGFEIAATDVAFEP